MTGASIKHRLLAMTQRSMLGRAEARGEALPGADGTQADGFAPARQAREEAIQRLQIGLFGIGAMVLLVGLASIIGSQADLIEDAAVPEAAPTTEPSATPTQSNPLADAGVVPDIAAEPAPDPATARAPSPPRPAPGNAAPSP
jgi:hypothetical protein